MLKIFFDKRVLGPLLFAVTIALNTSSSAQIANPQDKLELPPPEPILPTPEPVLPENEPPGDNTPDTEVMEEILESFTAPEIIEKPDYSRISAKAERLARLEVLFGRLKEAEDETSAELIAEDIWALWLESGSASVNLVLRRGADAQKKGNTKTARRFYDETLKLKPEFAEGWARSSRLALEEKNLSRALAEAVHALVLEPRHFYALWTMGNVFEQLGRNDEALEAYREANALHPQLKAVKDRLDALESEVNGEVL